MIYYEKTLRFINKLIEMEACITAINWCRGKSLETAWKECKRPDWLLWLAGRMAGEEGWSSNKEIAIACCKMSKWASSFSIMYKSKAKDFINVIRRYLESGSGLYEVTCVDYEIKNAIFTKYMSENDLALFKAVQFLSEIIVNESLEEKGLDFWLVSVTMDIFYDHDVDMNDVCDMLRDNLKIGVI